MTRVLVVEDDVSLARLVVATLVDQGLDVEWAADLSTARGFLIVVSPPFDVILCDYELPEYPGGLSDGKGTSLLRDVLDGGLIPYRPTVVLWSGLDRSREVAAEMGTPPDHVEVKSRLPEVLDLVARCRG